MHDPTKFSNIYFSKKKAQRNSGLIRFKVSIHKFFHQHTPPLKIFHLEFYIIVQYYFHPHFQQETQVYLQVTQVFVSQMFLTYFYQQLYEHSEQNHHCPLEWLVLYPLATCSYFPPPVTKQCLQPLSFSQFCSIYDGCRNLLLPLAPKFIC